VAAGECVLCLPLIHRVVVEYNEKVLILVTVRSEDTFRLLRTSLPERVILIRAPRDAPVPVGRFLEHWKPCIGVMVTGWLSPNLIIMSSKVRRLPVHANIFVCAPRPSTLAAPPKRTTTMPCSRRHEADE
jgi:3-deoxy-D-manno-octulosonic-acid transferase